jgi:hypothetical protein
VAEIAEDLAGYEALEAANDLSFGFSLSGAALDVVGGRPMGATMLQGSTRRTQ